MAERTSSALEILVVEDDPGDLLMITEALEDDALARHAVHVARDGAEALDFLRHRHPHESAPAPDLVLLDLNLPKLDGYDVLAAVKGDPLLAPIPVVVLSTSDADEDVARSYGAHANAFLTKPGTFEEFAHAVRAVIDIFASVVTLPPRPR